MKIKFYEKFIYYKKLYFNAMKVMFIIMSDKELVYDLLKINKMEKNRIHFSNDKKQYFNAMKLIFIIMSDKELVYNLLKTNKVEKKQNSLFFI